MNSELLVKIRDRLANNTACESTMSRTLSADNMLIPVGVSNRHIHLSVEDVETLFGKGYQLTKFKDLKQTGQFAAKECVMIAGPKGSISNVRILGPERKQSQVEVSRTDSFALGIKAPIRESGDLANSADICLIGPKGSVQVRSGAICAKRHIHMNSEDARRLHVTNGQVVNVKTLGERTLTFGEVVVRVNDAFVLEFHIDTDEANAACLGSNDAVVIVG